MFAAYRNHASAYRRLEVETSVDAASPHKLISMLYDGAIASMQRARAAIEQGDVAAKCEAVTRAIRIVDEGLKASLDPAGGVLATRLRDLYEYVSRRLLVVSLRGDLEALDESIALIGGLRDAWVQIAPSGQPARAGVAAYAA